MATRMRRISKERIALAQSSKHHELLFSTSLKEVRSRNDDKVAYSRFRLKTVYKNNASTFQLVLHDSLRARTKLD